MPRRVVLAALGVAALASFSSAAAPPRSVASAASEPDTTVPPPQPTVVLDVPRTELAEHILAEMRADEIVPSVECVRDAASVLDDNDVALLARADVRNAEGIPAGLSPAGLVAVRSLVRCTGFDIGIAPTETPEVSIPVVSVPVAPTADRQALTVELLTILRALPSSTSDILDASCVSAMNAILDDADVIVLRTALPAGVERFPDGLSPRGRVVMRAWVTCAPGFTLNTMPLESLPQAIDSVPGTTA